MNKNYKNILILSLFAFLPVICLNLTAQNSDNDLYAVITKTEGNALFQPENTVKWLKAKIGLGLRKGDQLKTGEKSKIEVTLEGGTVIKLEQNSIIKIETLIVDLSKKTSEVHLNMPKKGSLLSFVSKMKRAQLNIKTPICTASVRGTGLSVDVIDDKTTNVAVFEGKVVVKDFAEEAGLPKDENELMLSFLHEISVKPDQETTVTDKGISKPRKIQGDLLTKKEDFKQLKSYSEETRKSWEKSSYEQRKSERVKIRNEVITLGE